MKEETIKAFDEVATEFVDILASTTDEQLNTKPDNGAWSMAQLGDHILQAYDFVGVLHGTTAPTRRSVDEKIEGLRVLFSNQSTKMQAPETIVPPQGDIAKEDLLAALQQKIAQINEAIYSCDLSETRVDYAIPSFGEFTRLEWIWFTIHHTRRHLEQLKERRDMLLS